MLDNGASQSVKSKHATPTRSKLAGQQLDQLKLHGIELAAIVIAHEPRSQKTQDRISLLTFVLVRDDNAYAVRGGLEVNNRQPLAGPGPVIVARVQAANDGGHVRGSENDGDRDVLIPVLLVNFF